jgi:hypothetical protein
MKIAHQQNDMAGCQFAGQCIDFRSHTVAPVAVGAVAADVVDRCYFDVGAFRAQAANGKSKQN